MKITALFLTFPHKRAFTHRDMHMPLSLFLLVELGAIHIGGEIAATDKTVFMTLRTKSLL